MWGLPSCYPIAGEEREKILLTTSKEKRFEVAGKENPSVQWWLSSLPFQILVKLYCCHSGEFNWVLYVNIFLSDMGQFTTGGEAYAIHCRRSL